MTCALEEEEKTEHGGLCAVIANLEMKKEGSFTDVAQMTIEEDAEPIPSLQLVSRADSATSMTESATESPSAMVCECPIET